MLRNWMDALRRAWENLSERERKLLGILGGVMGAFALLVPFYWIQTSVIDLETENESIEEFLVEIQNQRKTLLEQAQIRQAARTRYANPAPPLGSFVETKANEVGIKLRGDITEEPEQKISGYTKRSVRVKLSSVGLRSMVQLMAAIANAPYPVTIDFVRVEHYQAGDQYNVELGVSAFDQPRKGEKLSQLEFGETP